MKIAGIILAAGESRRMDFFPKANLMYRGKTFLRTIAEIMRSEQLEPVVCVTGKDTADIKEANAGLEVTFVKNENWTDGQLSSIRKGIDSLPEECEAAVIHLVDQPLIQSGTVRALLDEFSENKPPLALPVFEGQRGHPVLFSKKVFAQLMAAPLEVGARQVVWDNADVLSEVPVTDRGIVININTPLEHNRWCLSCSCDTD